VCGKWVDLVAEADTWDEQDDGSMKIAGYGPATGSHHGFLLVDDGSEESYAIDFRRKRHAKPPVEKNQRIERFLEVAV